MKTGGIRGRAGIGLLALLAAALVVVQASVFVYYNTNYTLAPTAPPVYLEKGSNAGQRDLYGYTITVNVGPAGASATVTLHPTYEKNYYKDILRIKNQDNNTYYAILRVVDTLNDNKVVSAYMYVYDANGNRLASLDLKNTNAASPQFTITSGADYRVDVVIVIDETGGSANAAPQLTDTTFQVELVYSPSTETPP